MNKLEKMLTIGTIGLSACAIDNNSNNSEVNYEFLGFGRFCISTDEAYNKSISAGDFDGDNDLDLAIIKANGKLLLYENKIPQKSVSTVSLNQESTEYDFLGFGKIIIPHEDNYTKSVVAADFDGDGDSDIAVIGVNGCISLYESKISNKNRLKN